MARLVHLASTKAGVSAQVDSGDVILGSFVFRLSDPVVGTADAYINAGGTKYRVTVNVRPVEDTQIAEVITNHQNAKTSSEARVAFLADEITFLGGIASLADGDIIEVER